MKITKTHYMTMGVILLFAIGIIGWDLYVVKNEIKGDTVSALIYEASLKLSFIPYLIGVLMGHLFWPKKKSELIDNDAVKGLFVCLYLTTVPLTFDVLNLLLWKQEVVPLAGLLLGLAIGHFFWLNKGKDGE